MNAPETYTLAQIVPWCSFMCTDPHRTISLEDELDYYNEQPVGELTDEQRKRQRLLRRWFMWQRMHAPVTRF
jgi:hypothetical protein